MSERETIYRDEAVAALAALRISGPTDALDCGRNLGIGAAIDVILALPAANVAGEAE